MFFAKWVYDSDVHAARPNNHISPRAWDAAREPVIRVVRDDKKCHGGQEERRVETDICEEILHG